MTTISIVVHETLAIKLIMQNSEIGFDRNIKPPMYVYLLASSQQENPFILTLKNVVSDSFSNPQYLLEAY